MLDALLLVAALGSDPVVAALERFEAVESYRATLRASHRDGTDIIRYSYRKPGFIRMEFIQPHRGAVLVYDPLARLVTLRPFGPGRFPRLSLRPQNPLIRSPGGHTVDRSDVGALLRNARALQRSGTSWTVGEEPVGRVPTLHVAVEGIGGSSIEGVYRYDLWLERTSLFPVKAESRDAQGELLESLLLDDVEIGIDFPERFFDP